MCNATNLNTLEQTGATPAELSDFHDRILTNISYNLETDCIDKKLINGNTRPRNVLKNKSFYSARAIWMLYRGPIPDGMVVRHTCDRGDTCINLHHLALGTHMQNMHDMHERGRKAILTGFDNPSSKLDQYRINKILELYYFENYSSDHIATMAGVSGSSVRRLVKGLTYKDQVADWLSIFDNQSVVVDSQMQRFNEMVQRLRGEPL